MLIDHRLDFPAWPQEQMETIQAISVANMVASAMKAIKICHSIAPLRQ